MNLWEIILLFFIKWSILYIVCKIDMLCIILSDSWGIRMCQKSLKTAHPPLDFHEPQACIQGKGKVGRVKGVYGQSISGQLGRTDLYFLCSLWILNLGICPEHRSKACSAIFEGLCYLQGLSWHTVHEHQGKVQGKFSSQNGFLRETKHATIIYWDPSTTYIIKMC